MGLRQSREYRGAVKSLVTRIERIARGEANGTDAYLDSLEYKVAVEVRGILRAIRNVDVAGHQLRRLGAPGVRRPKSVTYEDLILYHDTAALNEAAVYRNRVSRLLRHFEKHFRDSGNRIGLAVVRNTRKLVLSNDPIQDARNQHVHGKPFVPPALSTYAVRGAQEPSSYRRRQLTAAYKRTARLHGRTWTSLASVLDALAEFHLALSGLLMTPSVSREDVEAEVERIRSRLHRAAKKSGMPTVARRLS